MWKAAIHSLIKGFGVFFQVVVSHVGHLTIYWSFWTGVMRTMHCDIP